jgi:hypothetical protein
MDLVESGLAAAPVMSPTKCTTASQFVMYTSSLSSVTVPKSLKSSWTFTSVVAAVGFKGVDCFYLVAIDFRAVTLLATPIPALINGNSAFPLQH